MKYYLGKTSNFCYEVPCFLCAKMGRIEIGENRKISSTIKTCPICKGKGFLKITKGD